MLHVAGKLTFRGNCESYCFDRPRKTIHTRGDSSPSIRESSFQLVASQRSLAKSFSNGPQLAYNRYMRRAPCTIPLQLQPMHRATCRQPRYPRVLASNVYTVTRVQRSSVQPSLAKSYQTLCDLPATRCPGTKRHNSRTFICNASC